MVVYCKEPCYNTQHEQDDLQVYIFLKGKLLTLFCDLCRKLRSTEILKASLKKVQDSQKPVTTLYKLLKEVYRNNK